MRLSVSSSASSTSSRRQRQRLPGPFELVPRECLERRVHLVEGNLVGPGREGARVGVVRKAIPHRGGGQVHLVHRRQAEDQLDGLDHADLRGERVIDRPAPGVRADDLGERAMAVDVVETGLGVVLDHEDRRLGPELAARDRLHDPAQRQVVIGDRGAWGRQVWPGPRGVVVRQEHDDQVRQRPPRLKLAELLEELAGAVDVGYGRGEAGEARAEVGTQGFDRGPGHDLHLACAVACSRHRGPPTSPCAG